MTAYLTDRFEGSCLHVKRKDKADKGLVEVNLHTN